MRVVVSFVVSLVACAGGPTLFDDGGEAPTCPRASVTFALKAAPENTARWCVGTDCTREWLTIVDPAGEEHEIDRPCLPDCDGCEPVGCPASCAAPSPLPAEGVQRTWTGDYFATGACAASGACTSSVCAPSGRYVAKMCVSRDLGTDPSIPICSASSTRTCARVAFDWPPAPGVTIVTGVVGSATESAGSGEAATNSW